MKNEVFKIALAISLVSIGCDAKELRQNNQHIYSGVRIGYADSICASEFFNCNNNSSLGFGILAGYQYNPWLSMEFSSTDYGSYTFDNDTSQITRPVKGSELSWLFSYDDSDKLDVYIKVGATYQNSKSYDSFGFVSALGFDYILTPSLSIRTEYQIVDGLSGNRQEQADRYFISLGLIYHFSQLEHDVTIENSLKNNVIVRPDLDKAITPAPTDPDLNKHIETVKFDLNSSYISNDEKPRLINLAHQLSQLKVDLNISGYTDNTGTTKYNEWLAYRRAKRVLDFLVLNGFNPDRIRIDCYKELKFGDKSDNRRTDISYTLPEI